MRSAKAPAMIAGVMTAKVAWYIRKTFSGTVLASSWVLRQQSPAEGARQRADDGVESPPWVKASE